MNLELRNVNLPEFGVPEEMPVIPRGVYEERCEKLYNISDSAWLIVSGDRGHFANLHHVTESHPILEEVLLILRPENKKHLLVGNDRFMYKAVLKPKLEVGLCQSFSLLGQDRTKSPKLKDI